MCVITVARPYCHGCCQPLISGDLVGLEYCGEGRHTQTPLSPLGSCGRNLMGLTIRESRSYCPRIPPVRAEEGEKPPQLGLSCSTAGWAKVRRALAVIQARWGRERWEEAVVELLLKLAGDPRLILDPSWNASALGAQRPQAHGEFFDQAANKISFLCAINEELDFTRALGGGADSDYEQRLVRYWHQLQSHECGRGRHGLGAAMTVPDCPQPDPGSPGVFSDKLELSPSYDAKDM